MIRFFLSDARATCEVSLCRVALGLGIAIASIVPAFADMADDCKSAKSIDVRIAACSSLIGGGTAKSQALAQAHLRRGTAYYEKKDYAAAITDYDAAIVADPSNASAYYERGVTKSAMGETDAAISDLDAAIGFNKTYARAFTLRGLLWRKKGDLAKAIADYTMAIGLDPNKDTPYLNRGVAYNKGGDKDLAIQDFGKAIELKPVAATYYERAVAYIGKGDKVAAATDLNKALELDPQFAPAKERLAAIGGAAAGKPTPPPATQAEAAPASPAASAQENPEAQATALANCSQKADLDLRVAGCRALVGFKSAPAKEIARGYLSLATVFAVRGQDDLALANIELSLPYNEEAVRKDPSNIDLMTIRYSAYQRQALLVYKKGEHDKAASMFEKMKALDPKDEMQTSDWMRAAKAGFIKFNGTGAAFEFPPEGNATPAVDGIRPESAQKALAPSQNAAPATPPAARQALNPMEAACKQSDDIKAKIENCTSLINAKNNSPKDQALFHIARAWAYKETDKTDLALADIETSIRLEPSAMAYGIRGGMKAARDPAGALRDAEEAFRIAPTDETIIRMRYNAYERDALMAYKNGPRDQAIVKLEKLVKLDPKDTLHATQWLAEAKAGTIKVDGRKFTIGTSSNSRTIEFKD